VLFTKIENDMLAAEGMIRASNFAGAAALINVSRTRNGLPAITAFDGTTPVPGANPGCVPNVPNSSGTATVCGNMMEAMKWEKRIEDAYTNIGVWFLDMRGWGDLAKDTPLYWATPFDDILARGLGAGRLYGAGTSPSDAAGSAAAKGTYGW
jgi:hypothetical protein